jgi:isopentenyldiphosphate isomerase
VQVHAVTPPTRAQDQGELFDVCDEDGRPTGRTKPRALVHRDGDWHRSLHLWVVLRDPELGTRVVFQRRSRDKDTWPGALDVAVAGHLAAGESVEDALRESEEEIGLAVRAGDVVQLGERFRVDTTQPGVVDREVQAILAVVVDASFAALRPSPHEVDAVVALTPEDARRLVFGVAPAVEAPRLDARTLVVDVDAVRGAELVVGHDDYFVSVLPSVLELAAGRVPRPFRIGRG